MMKKYVSIACAMLIASISFGQNAMPVKVAKSKAPLQQINSNTKQVVRNIAHLKSNNNLGSASGISFLPQKKRNPLLSIGQINQPVVKKMISRLDADEAPIAIDTRDLKFSENGLLLSPDGYEIEFRTSGNSAVTDICATPRPYIINAANKSASCAFTVPCDDAANRDAAATGTKYFQMRWHVMTSGGAGSNIDQAMITAMMNTLNADFAPYDMIFCEDSARWVEDPVNYTHNSNTMEVSLKTAYNQRPADLINIYVVGDMTAGGYARFPYDPMGGPNFRGGIVMNRSNCNAAGHTLAHEMGHTFGLEHTFAGVDERPQCSDCYERVRDVATGSSNSSGVATPNGGPYLPEGDKEGDWCSDTNPHNTNTYNCNTSTAANGACDAGPWVNAPVNNHMSYSFCDSQFTPQQGRRMHCMANSYLSSWISYGGGVCGAQPPVADFVGTPTTWGSPSNVVFTDLSSPTSIIDTWTWDFNAAGQAGTVVPAAFVGQTPPTIVYTLPGGAAACLDYEVTLTITSANGNDTETKAAYITVCPPAGDCDTLDTDYNDDGPTNTSYNGANGFFTGVPNEGSVALADPAGFYEMYFTPNAGTSIVGGINVALGGLNDPDDDMTVQFSIYEDDGAGFPDIGGGAIVTQAYSPTALGVPNGAFVPLWIPITNPNTPITTATFHVGVEIFPGDATDSLYVISNEDGEGDGAQMTNFTSSTGCGLTDFNDPTGVYCPGAGYGAVNFDMWIIPMMGEYAPRPILTGFTESVVCDTTFVTLTDTVLYHDYFRTPATALVGMSYTFLSDGFTINSTTPLGTIDRTYTTAGPDVLRITAVNECGRSDTSFWTIPYNFLPTPDAEFSKIQANDVCIGDVIDFTADISGYQDYNWDFGDGTVASSGSSETTTHTYTAAGTYYTNLTVTSTGYQPDDIFYFEDFNAGIPGTYTLVDQDGLAMTTTYPAIGSTWIGNAGQAISSSWFDVGPTGVANDWMITPAIGVLPANQMLSWIGEASNAGFADGYEVRISTTGPLPATAANFNTVLFSIGAENAFPTTRAVSLAAYAGQSVYIAFVNNSNDKDILIIDDIWVGTTGPGCVANQQKEDFVVVIDCSIDPPVADVVAIDSVGCAPLTVTFTDNSAITTDPIDTWLYNFGDGSFYNTDGTPPPHLYATPGTYFASLEVCNAGGCTTDFVTIVVGTGVTAVAGTDQTICGGTTATLAGNDPSPDNGVWALIAGSGTPTTPTDFASGVTGLGLDTNSFTWTITGTGCTTVDTVNIIIATPVTAGNNGALTTCSASDTNNLFNLLVGAETGGTWIGPSALSNDSIGTFDPATNTAGTYQYYVAGIAPCLNDTADVVVTITTTDDPTFTYADFCAGTGGISGVPTTAGGSYSFNPDPADGATINTTTGAIANEVAGSAYNVQYLTNGTCPDSLTLTVNVGTPVTAGNNGALTTCSAASTTDLFTLLTGAAAGGNWIGPSALSGADQGTFDPTTNTAGTYQYYVTGVAPCGNDTADVVVTITTTDDPSFTYADFCAGLGGVSGVPTTAGGSYSFNPDPADGAAINAVTGAISNEVAGASYNVQYFTGGACSDSLTIAVNVGTPVSAGSNGALTTCSAAGTTDLFTLLTGAAAGGTWIGPSALTAADQGTFDPATNTAGTYQYYVTGVAPCGNDTADVVVTINTTDDPTFTYADFCAAAGGVSGAPATAGGSYSFNPDLLDGSTINTATGAIANAVVGSTYNIQYITPAGPCRDSLTLSAVANGIPTVSNIVAVCNVANTSYTVSFDVSGGTGGVYTVVDNGAGVGGTFTGSTWTSNPIFPSTAYDFDMDDANGCGPVNVSGNKICICISDAGTMNLTPLNLCETATANAVHNADHVLDPNDYIMYVLHTNNTATLGTVLDTNVVAPSFSFTSPLLTAGTTYYISAVVGDSLGNFVDFNDACLQVAPGTPVTWESAPNAGANDSTTILCNNTLTPLDMNTLLTVPGGVNWVETTAVPSLQFDPATGLFDVNGLSQGIYSFIYYVVGVNCPNDTAYFGVDVNSAVTAGTDGTLTTCAAADTTNLFTKLLGAQTGGDWLITPSVLTNDSLGTFNPASNIGGTYKYYVTGAPPCVNDTADVVVTITPSDDPTFTYADFCAGSGGVSGTPVTPGGTYSFNPDPADGALIVAATGAISNAVAGSAYNIQYLTNGTCPDDTTLVVNVQTPPNAGADSSLLACTVDGPTDLFTLLVGAQTGGTWFPGLTSTTGVFDPGVDAATTYQYIVPGTGSCDPDTADVIVTVLTCVFPNASFTPSAVTVCVGDSIIFTDNSTGTNITDWTWTFPTGTPLAANVQGPHTVFFNTPGLHNINLSITDSAGTDDTTIVVNVTNCISGAFTTSADTICAGDSIVFTDATTATLGASLWSWNFDVNGSAGVTPPFGTNPAHTVFYSTPGVYTVELIVFAGAISDTVTKTVTITDCSPVAGLSINGDTICKTESLSFNNLSTGNPSTYLWEFEGGVPDSSTSMNPGLITYNTPGNYSVKLTVTNEYGVDADLIQNQIWVLGCEPPNAIILKDDEDGIICEDNCIQFTYKDTVGRPDSLIWTFQGIASPGDTVKTTDYLQAMPPCWEIDSIGTYIVSVTAYNAYGVDVAYDTVKVFDTPIVFAGNDITVDFGFDAQIRGEVRDPNGNILSPEGGTIDWSPTTYLDDPYELGSVVVQPIDTTLYTMTFVDENGCTASDDVVVNVNFEFHIGVPSAFSPTSSTNNVLYVKGKLAIESSNFTIYNRYGQKVFESTDIDQGWDGTHNGKELNPGVFVYYVKVTYIDGTSGELKGNVTLIK